MKRLVLLVCVVFATLSGTAWAESESCSAVAAQKKLAGAAKTSFLKKCEKDAKATSGMEDKAEKPEKKG